MIMPSTSRKIDDNHNRKADGYIVIYEQGPGRLVFSRVDLVNDPHKNAYLMVYHLKEKDETTYLRTFINGETETYTVKGE